MDLQKILINISKESLLDLYNFFISKKLYKCKFPKSFSCYIWTNDMKRSIDILYKNKTNLCISDVFESRTLRKGIGSYEVSSMIFTGGVDHRKLFVFDLEAMELYYYNNRRYSRRTKISESEIIAILRKNKIISLYE